MNRKIKVLIVDDHALVREGLRALLSLAPDIEVVGEAKKWKGGSEEGEGPASRRSSHGHSNAYDGRA